MTENAFIQLVKHPVKFRMFLFSKLPAAFFSGVRLKYADEEKCEVIIPYKWFTKNPFRSTYFACLSMAAELTTGVLAMAHVYKKKPAVSMLVTGIEGKFYKKATGLSFFTCADGEKISDTISTAITLQ